MGGKSENYVVDGQQDNGVISILYRCMLFWPISIVSVGRLNKLGGKRGGGGGGGLICPRKLYILKGDKLDGNSMKTPIYIICLVMLIILEGLVFDAVCNPVV